MIELWHCPDARSFRVLWVLEELGLPYELHLLPFPPRVRAPEYLQVNPLGTIALLLADHLKLSERFTPAVADYWSRLNTRQAFQAAKRVQIGTRATELALIDV